MSTVSPLKQVSSMKVVPMKAIIKCLGHLLRLLALVVALGSISSLSQAAIEVYEFDNPQQEAQYKALIEELRCPKCQNQNLAGSDSQISKDLKQKTYEMVVAGKSDAEIREYMQQRYGDFISYKPPVRPSTWILWYFPPLILLVLVAGWMLRNKNNNKKLATGQSAPAGANQTTDTVDSNPIDVDNVGSDLSQEESDKLKSLLEQHSDQDSQPK